MRDDLTTIPLINRPLAMAIAACAVAVPFAMSKSSTPSPNHPRTMYWYLRLREPPFKPPDWLFPVAWLGIEAGLATSAYRLLRSGPSQARTRALGLWAWNVAMIGGWSRLFFKRRQLGLSTVAAASLVASSAAFVKAANTVDKTAARTAVPLVAWVAFATVLTATIWSLNDDG